MHTSAASSRFGGSLTDALTAARAPLLFAFGCGLPSVLPSSSRSGSARQPFLGRHLRGDRVPAAARGFAAQGLVPDDRHRGRRHDGRGADRVLSAGSDRLSRASGPVGRSLRFRRHGAAQLRVLRGGARRLYRGDHRRRQPRRDRRREPGCLHAGGLARQRDLHRDRVRRRRPRRHRSRRRSAAARAGIRRSGGRDRRPIYPHAGAGGTATCRTRKPSGASSSGASSRSIRRSTRRSENRATCATTRRHCRAPSTACSGRWTAGAALRPI